MTLPMSGRIPESRSLGHRVCFLLGTLIFLFGAGAQCAPLTLKELIFLVRQRTGESEIMVQARSRHLLAPLDAAALKSLKENGASESLISKLQAPGIALDAGAAAAEASRQAAAKTRVDAVLADDAARREKRDREWNQAAEQLREAHSVQGWLQNKLYTLQKKDLKPLENRSIAPVTIFGLFHGAMSSPPARDFAPKLAEAYARLKKQYGNDFEIIFISHDRDEYNQKQFMRTFGLTCPTMRFDPSNEGILQFGDRPPWFVLVADNGKALSLNGVNKQFIEPNDVLMGLEQLLAALHR